MYMLCHSMLELIVVTVNDRLSPTRKRVNLHVGVANRFISNNEQTANA